MTRTRQIVTWYVLCLACYW